MNGFSNTTKQFHSNTPSLRSAPTAYDLSYMGCIPNLIIMAPSDEIELKNMIRTAHSIDDSPSVVRYPRGTGYGVEKLKNLFGYDLPEGIPAEGKKVEIGKGRIVRNTGRAGAARKDKVAILR